ncbi:hypothetical protein bthur0011_57760 [Bacillus thuringiensis serovar huazhongensis BGSC 4BD1]|nr:hypothetical protein bthur0011_57760 [Bacillus thuringiensis serovar huazhongensis BGSC 4BD1]
MLSFLSKKGDSFLFSYIITSLASLNLIFYTSYKYSFEKYSFNIKRKEIQELCKKY